MEGRLSFKQYILLKSLKFGIKSYKLCECDSGYLWSFIIYIGRHTRFQSTLISEEKSDMATDVFSPVEPTHDKGPTL
jgi:uncharacterized membrane protein